MPADIANLVVRISGDSTGAENALDSVNDKVKSASGGFKGMLENALSLAGGISIYQLAAKGVEFLGEQLVDSVKAGMDFEQIQAQTTAVLKSTNDASGMTAASIDALAESLSKTTTFSADTVQGAENLLLTFTGIGKDVFPQATTAVLDMSQALGQDTKSSAIELGKALGDPIKGITALQRVGVSFTEAQKEQIKAMVKAGNTAGAQKLILAELTREFGGSAKAAGSTFAGALKIAGNELEVAKEKIGVALIPILTQLATALAPVISALGDKLSEALAHVSGFINTFVLPAVTALTNFFNANILPAVQALVGILQNDLMGAFNQVTASPLPGMLKQLGETAKSVLLPALSSIANLVKGIVVPIFKDMSGFLTGTLIPAYRQIATFILTNVVPAVAQMVTWFREHVIPIIKQVSDVFTKQLLPMFYQVESVIIQNVIPAAEGIWNTISSKLIPAMEKLWNKISPILIPALQFVAAVLSHTLVPAAQLVGTILKNVVGPAISFVIGVLGTFIDIIATVIGKIGDVLGILGRLKDFIGGKLSDAWNGLGQLISGIWGGIKGGIKDAINGIIDIFNGLIKAIDNIHVNIPQVGPFGGGSIGFSIPLIPHLASGGDILKAGLALVGEDGPEIVRMPTGSHVYSHRASEALMRVVGGNAASAATSAPAQPVIINVHVAGRNVAQALLPDLAQAIRSGAGLRI